MNRMSDWPDQFFLSIFKGVPCSCLAYGTLLCGFSSSSTCVLSILKLIISLVRDDSLAYISDHVFLSISPFSSHILATLCFSAYPGVHVNGPLSSDYIALAFCLIGFPWTSHSGVTYLLV